MVNLEITFLGTGTSLGVPIIGCDCEVCTSQNPHDKRSRASVYMRSPELSWVIDTGPDFRQQCLREKVTQLDAVLYTHSHTDHVMGFDDLRMFCFSQDKAMPIYASDETMGNLKRVFEFAFNGENRFRGYTNPDPHPVHGTFFLGSTEIIPLNVLHGKTNVTGFLFRKNQQPLFAYLTDCNAVSDTVIDTIQGVSVLAIDALRYHPHPTHFSVQEALGIAQKSGAKQTWLTHIGHKIDHEAISRVLPKNVAPAYDGLKITL